MFGLIVALFVAVGIALVPLFGLWWLIAGKVSEPWGSFIGVGVGIVYAAALVTFGVWALSQVGL